MALVIPTFQPQNPAINGYSLGWLSCTSYSGAMAASYERQVKLAMTGESIRRRTGDTVGGTNLAQLDKALINGWHIDLEVYYRMSWTTFERLIDRGMDGVLQLWYAPIADSRFDAGRGFKGNHAVNVPSGWGVQDPLADGRYGQAYRYKGEPYPRELLRNAAGKLNVAGSGYRAVGSGLVYAAMTVDRTADYSLVFTKGAFFVYRVGPDGRILPGEKGRYATAFSADTSTACSMPRSYAWPGVGSRTLAMVTNPKSRLYRQYVGVPQANVKLDVS
jgi:hypothetical protein